jgi:hypothetical protein
MMVDDHVNGIEVNTFKMATVPMPSAPPLSPQSDREYEFGRPLNRVTGNLNSVNGNPGDVAPIAPPFRATRNLYSIDFKGEKNVDCMS